MRACLHALLALAASASALPALGAEPDFAKLAWMAGCWRQPGDAGSVEQWLAPAGGTMLGMSRIVRQGKTVEYEFMRIAGDAEGRLAFHAQPSGKPPESFPAASLTDTEVVFENPQHGFPQRVAYASDGPDRLNARIEGQRNGQLRSIPYPMVRVACDGPTSASKP